MSGPRMNISQMNGSNRRPVNTARMPPPTCAQHDDLIKFILESWNKVHQDANRNSGAAAVYYQEQVSASIKNFEPFDLEAYWGQRIVMQHHPEHS